MWPFKKKIKGTPGDLYTGFYQKRYKRIVGKLSKCGTKLEDVFACVPFPYEGRIAVVLQHLNNPAFSLDKDHKRIIIDVDIKELEDIKLLSEFCHDNISDVISQYIEATTNLIIPKEVIKDEEGKIIV